MDNNFEIENDDSATVYPNYVAEIVTILKSNMSPKVIREKIDAYHENDIAQALEYLNIDERAKLYSILDTSALSDILEYSGKFGEYISELGIKKRVAILSLFEPSIAAEYLREMEKSDRSNLVELMDEDIRREIMLLISFDEDEIGSRMSTNFVSVNSSTNVRNAMKELIRQAADNDNISTIYVVDDDDVFVGAIELKELIIARETTDLSEITMTTFPYVYANELIDDCIERIKAYSEDSIPILDRSNRLAGVLTSQDITELVGDVLEEDYAKLAGLTSEEDLNEPLRQSIGKRLPWLVVLLALGMLVSGVVGLFEHVVANLTVIVSFQSLILGMAGNVGTQSLAITIRVLTDDTITAKQKLYLVIKESKVGLLNGLLLGILSFVFIGLYLYLLKGEPARLSFSVSMCTGIALIVSMFLSSVAGTAVPIIFKKLKIDPAVASGPLITTINDLVAVVMYYGLAWVLLINILHL